MIAYIYVYIYIYIYIYNLHDILYNIISFYLMLIFIIYCLHLLYIFILCCMYKHIYFIYNKYATWSKELRASKSNDFPNKFGCDCFQGNFWFSKFNHVTRHQICFCLAMIPLTMSRLSCKACIESCIFFKFLFKSKQN